MIATLSGTDKICTKCEECTDFMENKYRSQNIQEESFNI